MLSYPGIEKHITQKAAKCFSTAVHVLDPATQIGKAIFLGLSS